jgi:hypothetical protein
VKTVITLALVLQAAATAQNRPLAGTGVLVLQAGVEPIRVRHGQQLGTLEAGAWANSGYWGS